MSEQALDTGQLERWAKTHVTGFSGPLSVNKFGGGQSNPTYQIKTPDRSYVLRRKPPGVLLKSAHAVDREFRVQSALTHSKVPVARMIAFCEDDGIIGSAFYLMEEVTGRIFDDPRLPGCSPDERGSIIAAMNSTLAAVHEVDVETAGLSDFGPSGHYYKRQTDRWSKQYHATQTEDVPDLETLMGWLQKNMPADDGQRTLVHGDYRLDNLIFSSKGESLLAVLDWELSTIGHPFADLASVIMQWSMPTGAEGRGLAGVDRAALGLWSDQRFIVEYCERRDIAGIENFGFYLAFCHFRMAAILQGVKKRALDGNASDPERGLRLGRYVPEFAMAGLEATRK